MDFELKVSNEVYGKVKMNSSSNFVMSNDNGVTVNTFSSGRNHMTNKMHKHSTDDYDIEIVHGHTSVLFVTLKTTSEIIILIKGDDDMDIHKFSNVMISYKGNNIYELKASIEPGKKSHVIYSNTPFVFLDGIIKTNKFSPFRISHKIIGRHTQEDKDIIEDVIYRWSRIITGPLFPNDNCELFFNIEFKELGKNVLGSAAPLNFRKYKNHYIPSEGVIYLNKSNWDDQKKQIKKDGKTKAYYTMLHEFGHILGIGTYWRSPSDNQPRPHLIDVNNKDIIDGTPVYTRYIGKHGLQKYRETMKDDKLQFIPIEDDGGAGTAGGHIEEGIETNNGIRYNDGHSHPGLDRELMTGIGEEDDEPEILSSITVGLLHDIGFDVNYKESDDGLFPMWASKNNITGGYLNYGESIEADIYVNGKVFHKFLKNTYSENIQNIRLGLNYGIGLKKIVLKVVGKVILFAYDVQYYNGDVETVEMLNDDHEVVLTTKQPYTIECNGDEISSIDLKLKGSILTSSNDYYK